MNLFVAVADNDWHRFQASRRPDGNQPKRYKRMAKQNDGKPLTVRCPNCKQTREPDFNETTKRYVCPICASPVDAQVLIEKKKRGLK
jgi:ribosomal protein S27E